MKPGDRIDFSLTTVFADVRVCVARFPAASTFTTALRRVKDQQLIDTTAGDMRVLCMLLQPGQFIRFSDLFDMSLLGGYGHGYAQGGVWNPRAFRCDSRVVDYRHGSGWCITSAGFDRACEDAFDESVCGSSRQWSYVEHCNQRLTEKERLLDVIPEGGISSAG